MMRVKKNDTVVILTGKDKGKNGTVIEVLSKKGKVKVKGIALVTRHVKARRQGEIAGIKQEESYIDLSNVMPLSSDKKPSRVNFIMNEDGTKTRVSNRTKDAL